jgi:hypothetical protein
METELDDGRWYAEFLHAMSDPKIREEYEQWLDKLDRQTQTERG